MVFVEMIWIAMLVLVTAGVKFLHDLTKSVENLNLNVGAVMERLDDHEVRIVKLEKNV